MKRRVNFDKLTSHCVDPKGGLTLLRTSKVSKLTRPENGKELQKLQEKNGRVQERVFPLAVLSGQLLLAPHRFMLTLIPVPMTWAPHTPTSLPRRRQVLSPVVVLAALERRDLRGRAEMRLTARVALQAQAKSNCSGLEECRCRAQTVTPWRLTSLRTFRASKLQQE